MFGVDAPYVTIAHVTCNAVASGLFGGQTPLIDIDSEHVHPVIATDNGELISSIIDKQINSCRYATTV